MTTTPTTIPGGLVDAHAHLTLDLGAGPGVAANRAAARAAGVLAVRDAGSRHGIPPDELDGAREVAAGAFLAPAGGHLPHLLEPTPPAALVDAARAQVAAGVPWIKLMADFPGPDHDWFAPAVNYDLELVAEVVRVAHAGGARVMAHVSGPVVGDLVAAGVDSIEHGPMVDEAVVEAMAERGTAWVPTVATIARRTGPLEVWRRTLPRAVALGVPVLVGTDELGPAGVAAEAEALVRLGGLSPADVLHAATEGARAVLRLPAQDGDAVTFAGDPAADVTSLARVLR
ncbi:MAG TPA: amidohydrolase family protein [Baekduia sp.]|uniref:amidohydrolase family protein n=1 Tax=Baekduia sp. TaxID=2600305 RepID=UPI002D79E285|nr:amidohydrolase family protein [Baekduia sp.]HET6506667.1 amidohydrolase family protein [Baekduia sp.]